jgi:CHASE2 domain-containing sensor protein
VTPLPALRRRRDDALIAAALAALALALALGGWAWRADRLLYDAALAFWERPAPADIVIVAIDDASVEAIGRWPWPRSVHATLLERLAAAEPKAIALDLVLSEPDADGDPWLATALQRAAPVVMPVAWQEVDGLLSVLAPTPALRAHVRLGAAESAVDADGVLRHLFLHAGPAPAPYPHLALALLQAGGDRLHPDLVPDAGPAGAAAAPADSHWRRADRLLLRFAGPPGTVPRLSYLDVLQGRVPASELAGRYLLVGMTAQGLGDTLATPVNARHQAMPGVEVLAQAAAMLRDGGGLRAVPPGIVGAASALALVALVLGFRRLGARRALPLALGTVPLVAAASVGAVGAGWVASPVPYIVPALLAYPLWSWRRLEHAVRVLDREIRALAVEHVAGAPAADPRPGTAGDPLALRLHELARAGQLLREARRFLAGTLEGLPTAMLVGDDHGRVALANARAAALFEVERAEDLQGLDLARLVAEFTPAAPVAWPAALAALTAGGPGLSVEARLGRVDHLVHVGAVELLGQRRLIVSVADLTPVREAQRQREETLAFVSHDLRGPASSMVLLADLHQQGRSPLPEGELVPELRRLAERTLALADDFVLAARAQTRPLTLEAVAPQDLLADGIADARTPAAAAGVTLAARTEGDAPLWLDRPLVVRALANLVSNAIRHAPPGSTVGVTAWRDRSGLRVDVTDAGPGLAADQRAALVRGEDALRVGGPGGVGLGLLVVRRVASRHGGSLTAAPGPFGRGECMSLRLADPDSGNPRADDGERPEG